MVLSQSVSSMKAITFIMKSSNKKKICDAIKIQLLKSFFGNEEILMFSLSMLIL